jgi:hypothetical protein
MAFYFVSTFAIAQTPTKQPALRLSRTKNLHFAKATFPGFSAWENYLLMLKEKENTGLVSARSLPASWDAQNKLSQK